MVCSVKIPPPPPLPFRFLHAAVQWFCPFPPLPFLSLPFPSLEIDPIPPSHHTTFNMQHSHSSASPPTQRYPPQRWLPQSGKWHGLLHDDKEKDVEPGLGQRRVGKMNRYIIKPGRPEVVFTVPVTSKGGSLSGSLTPPPLVPT